MILVTGATGNAGGAVVRALVDAGEEVVVSSGPRTPCCRPGAETAVGDLDRPESLTEALADARALFLLSGYRDMHRGSRSDSNGRRRPRRQDLQAERSGWVDESPVLASVAEITGH